MKILITGATGFVGQALIPLLLEQGHTLICISRSEEKTQLMDWYHDVEFMIYDIGKSNNIDCMLPPKTDVLVHLAWPDLSNYQSLDHIEKYLPQHIQFLKSVVESGVKQIFITGTCLEYGMQNGELTEDDVCNPDVPYAIAKDSLRKYMLSLKAHFDFRLQWIRLFYLYGEHQSKRSLLAQLNLAINKGDKIFNMSQGDQLRDFIPISAAVDALVKLIEHKTFDGIVNISTGNPVSVRTFVENRIHELNADIELNLGFYPYPDYEPMAFWGNPKKLNKIINHVENKDIEIIDDVSG